MQPQRASMSVRGGAGRSSDGSCRNNRDLGPSRFGTVAGNDAHGLRSSHRPTRTGFADNGVLAQRAIAADGE